MSPRPRSKLPLPADPLYRADRVNRLASGDVALEIVSAMPKDHWRVDSTAIRIAGEEYALIERQKVETSQGKTLHRFLLKRIDPGTHVITERVAYHPSEVQEVYRLHRVRDKSMWLSPLAPLWGLLDLATQERLSKTYPHDVRRATGLSVIGSIGVGLFSTLAAFWKIGALQAHWSHYVVLVLSLLLVFEGWTRGLKLKRGEVSESVLGRLIKPLAESLLRWEDSA